ncbi:MAG TPA: hypothetical protein DET40_20825 [Lentisphaeria bacterium]|nr:MAG: hypothetical protein A2X45_15445 [Lentisphaerae bacterium GWF2_50_93]HCE45997.1 hypothetical protein [Lentisphaeria bacterium]
MHTPFSSRCTTALASLLLFISFTSAQAEDKSLGAWTAKDPSTALYRIYGMAFGNNTYVIAGYNGGTCKSFIANSPDATTWTLRSTGSTSLEFNSVIFSKGRFIAVCGQPDSKTARIWTSDTNGNTWVSRSSNITVAGKLNAVASDGNGRLIAAGANADGDGWLTVSTDNGTTWFTPEGASFPGETFYGVGYAIGNWYAFSTSGTYKSTNGGTAWASVAGSPAVDDKGYKVASNKTTVVVASSTGPIWSKDGGATWYAGTYANGFTGSLTSAASSVVYADGTFVLAGRNSGEAWSSETGQTWKRWTLPSTTTYALCYGKKSFWCGGAFAMHNIPTISKSPSWFKARLGCSSDYPYTIFDAEDGPPNRIGLPQYRVNTASLNLVLESTLFYVKALGSPINFKLVYNSRPTDDDNSTIGPFGKNWRFRYESVVGRFGQDAILVKGGGRNFAFTTPKGENLDTYSGPDAELILDPPDGTFDKLVYKHAVPSFELTMKSSHLKYIYGTKGSTADVNDSLFYLSAIEDQFGNTTTLSIDAPTGRIDSIANGGRTFSFTYTGSLCSGISIPDGRSVDFTYDAHENLTSITDMRGYQGTYAYDAANLGFLMSMSTAGKTTTFTYADRPGYNEAGTVENLGDKYLKSLTRPNGSITKYELLDGGDTVKRTSPSGEITLISNEEGQTTSVKDPLGNVRNITFNDAKLPSSVTDEKGGVYTYEYVNGNMTRQTDAMGRSTSYEYDASSNLIRTTNALGKSWTYTGYANYQPGKITTPMLYETNFTYWPNGRMKDITDARGNKTSFTYDPYGNLDTATSPAPVSAVTDLTYDPQGFRCTKMKDASLNEKALEWDANDRLLSITYDTVADLPAYTNTYNAFGQTGFTDELGKSSTVVRDELGFITSVTNPLGHVTRKEYDADLRPSKTIDPLGRATSTSYDNAGRPILFTDARGFKIVKEYDSTGNLVSFKDKNGAETKYTYDTNGRLVSTSDPLKKTYTITRDIIGRISSTTNARLQVIGYEYDDNGLLKKKTLTGAATPLVENTLDENGNITKQIDSWGSTPATATQYAYDTNNRVTSITYPDAKTVALTYNNTGNIATITYPDGLVATYTYDTFNRQPVPSILKNNPGTEIAGQSRSTNAITDVTLSGAASANFTLSYDKRGRISTLTRPDNFTKSDYTYDDAGRTTRLVHSKTGGSAAVDFTVECSPNAVGNLSSENFCGASYYQSAQTPSSMALAYNAAGQLMKKGVEACISDADGNLTDLGAGTVKCTYDAENRLTRMVRKAGTTTDNTYNASGLRVKRVIGSETIFYHYLPSGTLLFTTDGSGTVMDRHVFAGGTLLATLKASGALIHYYGDLQGNARFIADNSGAVLVQYDYLPYGQVGTNKLGINDALIDNNPFTMNGILGVQDEGDGIFCMGKRFYEAASARFLSRDPLGFTAGSNLYAFGRNNPIIYADPTGKIPVVVPLVMAGAGFIYWCMSSSKSHEEANAEAAAINAKYRAEELKKAKELNDRLKGYHGREREMMMEAEGLHSSQSNAVDALHEGVDQAANRMGEVGEIGANTAQNLITGGAVGAGLDAGGAISEEIENQGAEQEE